MENAILPNSTTPSSSQAQVVQIASAQYGIELTTSLPASAQFRQPSLVLIEDTRQFFNKCVPLYKIALKGDWNAAKCMIDADNRLLKAAITKRRGTLLHAVAGTNHVHFVKELIELLDPYDLELQDINGNTAFCYAAASGNIQIAAMMIKKNRRLPRIRGGEGNQGMTPLYMAALHGRSDMAWYLYYRTTNIFEEEDWNTLFFSCLENGLYDLALQMSQTKQRLAFIRNENNETGLHLLARKSSDFNCQRRWYLQNVINSSEKPTPILQLVRHLWSMLRYCTETETRLLIGWPSQVTFDATEVGNFHFVAELIRSYPDLIRELDDKNRSIIHIAVVHRHSSIFTLIHELGFINDFIKTSVDEEQNNILHCAAKLAPSYRLNLISGAALQMTHELLWFEEVKKITPQSQIEKKNSNGKTPYELFAQEHKELLTKAESWTKTTANTCILVSTVIAAGVFMATFNIPGGNNKNTGTPNYLQKSAFLIFAMSNATSLISSSASILIFLSILISSYAEDNYFKSLPFMLLFGLIAQFISITSMMIAFSASFFVTYYHGFMWIPSFISVLGFLPVTLFAFLLFPLWSDIIYSSYFCMSLFRPSKYMLY